MRRQQAGEDERGWARRLLDRLLRRRNEAEDRKAAAPAPVSPEEQPIPDPVLVELAAIHLHRRNLFDEISDAGALAAQPDLVQIADTVAAACDDAEKPQASDWPWHPRAVAEDIIAYREPFLARQSGVRTH